MNPEIFNSSLVTPGYFFVGPFGNNQAGPAIYDNQGHLVWTGYGSSGPPTANSFIVCDYGDVDRLCMFQGNQVGGHGYGHGVIMDNQYNIVHSVHAGDRSGSIDSHEFNMVKNGSSVLVTQYFPQRYDLSDNGITNGQGWVIDGLFQELDVETGSVIFEWSALDHVALNETYVVMNQGNSGDGLSAATAYDWFHINAVDINADGDYYMSARHTSCIYKINHNNGDIIWRLGGSQSTFDIQGFNFSYQHDVRVVSDNSSTVVLTLFDNAANELNQSSLQSSGKMVQIDLDSKVATQIQAFYAPNGGLLSQSQGNTQILPNGNVVVGWGNHPYLGEFSSDGKCLWWSQIGNLDEAYVVQNYRAYKFNFTSNPLTRPAVYSYALNSSGSAPTSIYVSWNGATEVGSWNFFSATSPLGPFSSIGNTIRDNFESMMTYSSYAAFVIAEAVDVNGAPLANSSVTPTFVPGDSLAISCNMTGCPTVMTYGGAQNILSVGDL